LAILSTVFQRKMAEWNDHTDVATGEVCRGFMDVVCGLVQRLPEPSTIEKQADKNALQTLDMSDPEAGEAFKAEHYLDMKNWLSCKPYGSPPIVRFRITALPTTTSVTGNVVKNSEEAAKCYISTSLKREFDRDNGTTLKDFLPSMSPINSKYLAKKTKCFQKKASFVGRLKGVGEKIEL